MSAAYMNDTSTTRIKGVYAHLDCMLTGIDRLKKAGFAGQFQTLAPLPRHEIEEAMYDGRPSPVRWWTLTGAIIGLTIGFLLTSLTAIQWPMINPGGKPVVSLPAYAVIMFECTIFFGCHLTGLGLIVHAGLPAFFLDKSLQDPRASDDKFIIVFTEASELDQEKIVGLLEGSGATEVAVGDDAIYEVPNV